MQTIQTKELDHVTGGQVVSRSSGLTNSSLTTFFTQFMSQIQQSQLQNQNGFNNPMFMIALLMGMQQKNKTVVAGPGYYSWSA
jgi:hypothetical protein